MGALQRRLVALVGAYAGLRTIKHSIRDFADFEQQMANVSTMLNKQTMQYLPAYSRQMRELSVRMGEDTQSLSKGLYDILSASIDASKAMDVLEVSARAATAGMTNTGVAADAITTVLNSYGMSADKAADVSSDLFETVQRGKTTFSELAQHIGKVAALASSANMPLEELLATISTLTRAGMRTDIAMTGVRAILSTFMSPTAEAADAAMQLGLNLRELTQEGINMQEVFEKLSRLEASDLSRIFGNVRGLSAMAAAMKQVSGHAADVAYITETSGADVEAFGKMTETSQHQFDRYTESAKELRRVFAEDLAPAVGDMAKAFADMAKKGSNLRKLVKTLGEAAGDAARVSANPADIAQELWQTSKLKKAEETIEAYETLQQGIPNAFLTNPRYGFEQAENDKKTLARMRDGYEKALAERDYLRRELGIVQPSRSQRGRRAPAEDLPHAGFIGPAATGQSLGIGDYSQGIPPAPPYGPQQGTGTQSKQILTSEVDLYIDSIREERRQLGLNNIEREQAIALQQAEVMARSEGKKVTEEQASLIKAEVKALEKAKRLASVGHEIGNAFAQGIGKSILYMQDLGDAAKAVGRQIIEIAIQSAILQPAGEALGGAITGGLGTLFSPTPNALGNVFSMGSVVPFAKGAVFDKPFMFPMFGGRTGLGAEAGPEAIMPLKRGPGGRLGVESGGGTVVNLDSEVKIINQSGIRLEQKGNPVRDGNRMTTTLIAKNIMDGGMVWSAIASKLAQGRY